MFFVHFIHRLHAVILDSADAACDLHKLVFYNEKNLMYACKILFWIVDMILHNLLLMAHSRLFKEQWQGHLSTFDAQ